MAKPATTKIHPQTVLRGQTVRSRFTHTDEVVRSVTIVVHLANGMDEIYEDTEKIALVDVPRVEFPKELVS